MRLWLCFFVISILHAISRPWLRMLRQKIVLPFLLGIIFLVSSNKVMIC
jgi:hypothetical protein